LKKGMIAFLLIISTSLLLIGCGTGQQNDSISVGDSFEDTQMIEVVASDGSDLITISGDNEIKAFIEALEIDEWDSEEIPSEVNRSKTFKMYQKDTVKLGESKGKNDELSEIATMTTYEDVPNVKFNVKNFSFDVKVPEDVAEYLHSIQ